MSNPFTESIQLSNETSPKRGRPKESKSKTYQKTCTRKRVLKDDDTKTNDEPFRKKRRPNKSHRIAYPNHTDEDIRRQLALERKEKNRKSAKESRERRKRQEQYLTDRLPKGIKLKNRLIAFNKKPKV